MPFHEFLILTGAFFVPFTRKNGNANASSQVRLDSEHNLQEYTYKKITPCDVCSQVLRGKFLTYSTYTKYVDSRWIPLKGKVLIIFNK